MMQFGACPTSSGFYQVFHIWDRYFRIYFDSVGKRVAKVVWTLIFFSHPSNLSLLTALIEDQNQTCQVFDMNCDLEEFKQGDPAVFLLSKTFLALFKMKLIVRLFGELSFFFQLLLPDHEYYLILRYISFTIFLCYFPLCWWRIIMHKSEIDLKLINNTTNWIESWLCILIHDIIWFVKQISPLASTLCYFYCYWGILLNIFIWHYLIFFTN